MRRRRRYGYTSRYTKTKFYFSEKEIDFMSEKLDYNHFLLSEFFNLKIHSDSNKFVVHYANVFGTLALSYLRRNFNTWKQGNYHMTDLIRERVLSLMPKFLSDDAKHRLSIHEFVGSIKKTVKAETSRRIKHLRTKTEFKTSAQIVSAFENELDAIQSVELRSAGYGNLLKEEERIEALEISKYILETKLQIAFDQTERDFKIFLPYMKRLKNGIFSATYTINHLNSTIEITNLLQNEILLPKFDIKEIGVNSRFKTYADKYLAYELTEINLAKQTAVVNSFLNDQDVNLFFENYNKLSNTDNEVKMNSTFYGEGGFLSISIAMKPIRQIQSYLAKSTLKLICYFIVILMAVGIGSLLSVGVIFAILLYGGWIIAIGFLGIISAEIRNFRDLTIELKRYGKQ